jgi:hypothetical protein
MRLAALIERHAESTGRMVGLATSTQHYKRSICRAAWAYDASRSRVAAALRPGNTIPEASPSAGVNIRVSLVGDCTTDAEVSIALNANGRPACELRQALEDAMVARRTDLEFTAVWRHRGESKAITWRCGLVEWSIALSMDRAADKLIGLVEHCLASAKRAPFAVDMDTATAIKAFQAKSEYGPLVSSLQQTSRRATSRGQWAISVYQGLPTTTLWPEHGGVHLVPPVDRFWADPFLARDGDLLWVFFEELVYAAPKGTIRCLSIDRSGRIGEPMDVLEEACHLSYPNVFQSDGHWYMLPESSQRGDLTLYRARRFPCEWEPVKQLLTNVRIADATLHRQGSTWWMMAGSADSPGGTLDDTLHLYSAQSLLGPWAPASPYATRSDPTSSRPAGPLFEWNGRWVRPVQDCRGRYGRALHLMEMDHIDTNGPQEHLLATLSGDTRAGITCAHTYCRVGSDLAVDWLRWRPRWSKRSTPPMFRFSTYRAAPASA